MAQGSPSQISTLILPADVSWGEGGTVVNDFSQPSPETASDSLVNEIAEVLKKSGKKTAILLGRRVLMEDGLMAASKIAEKTGAKLLTEVFSDRAALIQTTLLTMDVTPILSVGPSGSRR